MSVQIEEKDQFNTRLAESWGSDLDWRRTLANALVITRREVRDSFRDWRIIVPIFLLTLVFPFIANVASASFCRLLRAAGRREYRRSD